MATLDKDGYEILSQETRGLPLRHLRQRTRDDDIRDIIRREMSRMADDAGEESFEEADDFEVGDDYDPTSPYEEQFDYPEPVEPPAQEPTSTSPDQQEAPPADAGGEATD